MLFHKNNSDKGSTILAALVGSAILAIVAMQAANNFITQKKIQDSADGIFRLNEVFLSSRNEITQTLSKSLQACDSFSSSSFEDSLLLKIYSGDDGNPQISAIANRCKNPYANHTEGRYYFCNKLLNKINNSDGLADSKVPITTFIGSHDLTIETYVELVDLSNEDSPAEISCASFNSGTENATGFRIYQSFHWYRNTNNSKAKNHRNNVVYYAEKI